MKNNRNQQVILKSRPADIPQADNFAIVASDIRDCRRAGEGRPMPRDVRL
jgi:NADPH-dependent curcumin reductase CurA